MHLDLYTFQRLYTFTVLLDMGILSLGLPVYPVRYRGGQVIKYTLKSNQKSSFGLTTSTYVTAIHKTMVSRI
jgi:hypothetical protein